MRRAGLPILNNGFTAHRTTDSELLGTAGIRCPADAETMTDHTENLYLDVGGTAAFGVLHQPDGMIGRDVGVIICPPFGWDEICAYRMLREWGRRLASSGHPALRLTLPGCGDSAGTPHDADRLDAWTDTVAVAAEAVRTQTTATAVVAIGLGLGGLLAYRAVTRGAAIDGLVLWATPARGKDLVRQLRAFSRLEYPQFFKGLPVPPPLGDGELEAGGFLLSAQTQTDLKALDLTTLGLPSGLPRGALLLERDGIAVDQSLRDALESERVEVTVAAGDGYAAMTSHPQESQVPETAIVRVQSWLEQRSGAADGGNRQHGPSRVEVEIESVDGTTIDETALQIPHDSVELSGVLAMPQGPREPVCVIFLHSGAIRRVGPSRMWVDVARRWAAHGIPSLRLDVEGIGDAGGAVAPFRSDEDFHNPRHLSQVEAAIDLLRERGVAERFVLIGLCSGAFWSFHVALDHPRVSACVLVNPRALIYDPALAPARDIRRSLSQPLTWRRFRDNVTWARITAVVRWLLSTVRQRLAQLATRQQAVPLSDRVASQVCALRDTGKLVTLVFAEREPLEEELVRSGVMAQMQDWPTFTVERVAVHDHTLRPMWAQQQLYMALERALERELRAHRVVAA
jgi:dienelactone hydrolase